MNFITFLLMLIIAAMSALIVYLLSYIANIAKAQKDQHDTLVSKITKGTLLEKKEYNNVEFTEDNINVYLINMSKVKDRFDHFVKQYEASDLKGKLFYRLEAINGKELPDLNDYITQKAMDEILAGESSGHRTKHYQLTRGAVGCYLSHMMIYKHLVQSQKYHALIFEDDVIFGPNIQYQIKDVLKNVPADWDILLLGCHCIKCQKNEAEKDAKYIKIHRFFFLHGVLVNRKGANAILKYIDDIKIEQQIDSVLSDMAEKNLINIYCAKPSIATQSHAFKTLIQIPLKTVKGIDPYAPVLKSGQGTSGQGTNTVTALQSQSQHTADNALGPVATPIV